MTRSAPRIAQRQQRAAVGHHCRRALCHGSERIDADVHRHQERFEADIAITPTECLLVGEADRMDDEVDRRPALCKCRERLVEFGHVRYVTVDQEIAAELLCKRSHPLFQRLALIAKCQFGARFVQLLRNAPSERAVIGKPHDQAALTLHQSRHPASASIALASSTRFGVGSASAAFRWAPMTIPSPTNQKKISATITPARLP